MSNRLFSTNILLTCAFCFLMIVTTSYSQSHQPWASWESSGSPRLQAFISTVGTVYSYTDGYVLVHLNKNAATAYWNYSSDVTVQSNTKTYAGFVISAEDKVSLSLILTAYATGKRIKVFLKESYSREYNFARIVQIID